MEDPKIPLTPAFDELVIEKLEEFHVPGISVAVVHESKVYARVNRCFFQ
jgi:CubicO group peptidase (beta-lactamase class C family)